MQGFGLSGLIPTALGSRQCIRGVGTGNSCGGETPAWATTYIGGNPLPPKLDDILVLAMCLSPDTPFTVSPLNPNPILVVVDGVLHTFIGLTAVTRPELKPRTL